MSVTIENVGPCRKRLRIEVPAERVAGTRAEILEAYRKQAAIPGFRPGKAPEPMVEKRYAKEINDELHQRLIPDTYRETLTEQKLRVVGYPQIEKVEHEAGKPLSYTAVVDTSPEFALPDYKGIAIKKKSEPVRDEDVTKTLDNLRDHQADFVPVEGRGLKTGDFAVVNYTGVADGKPIAELVPEVKTLGEQKDFWLLLETDAFLPGFCEQLLGATAGEKRQVLVNFPADFPQKAVAGKKATYFVDVTGIREKKLPEINDEFAKKVGAENVAKLQEEVRKGLERERAAQVDAELRRQVIDHLLSTTEFALPESLVAEETKSIVYELVRENSMRGASKEQLAEKKDEIFAHASQSAKERLRMSFILQAIAEKENIAVEEKDMESRIAQMAERYRTTAERLRAQLAERDALGEVEEQVLVGKTIDFLVANAKVESVA